MTAVLELPPPAAQRRSILRLVRVFAQGFLFAAVWSTLLFTSAGTVLWTRGWMGVCLYILAITTTALLVRRRNPGLLERRVKWIRRDTKSFDKYFLKLIFPLSLLQPTIAGFDVVRFGWTSLPAWTAYAGTVLFLISAFLINWVMVKNPHAETSVRIQTNQKAVTSGPYRFVRHPMYAGSLLMYAAKALVLGSVAALIVALPIAMLFCWRTALEDQTLHRELPGYQEYAANTRYRLLPGIW